MKFWSILNLTLICEFHFLHFQLFEFFLWIMATGSEELTVSKWYWVLNISPHPHYHWKQYRIRFFKRRDSTSKVINQLPAACNAFTDFEGRVLKYKHEFLDENLSNRDFCYGNTRYGSTVQNHHGIFFFHTGYYDLFTAKIILTIPLPIFLALHN